MGMYHDGTKGYTYPWVCDGNCANDKVYNLSYDELHKVYLVQGMIYLPKE